VELRRQRAGNVARSHGAASDSGSTLISVGVLDKKQFPTAEIVGKGNLLAVVSPNEWEAN